MTETDTGGRPARIFDLATVRADWRAAPTVGRWIVAIWGVSFLAGTAAIVPNMITSRHTTRVIAESLGGDLLGVLLFLGLLRMLLARRRWAWTVSFWVLLSTVVLAVVDLSIGLSWVGGALTIVTSVLLLVLRKTRAVGAWIQPRYASQGPPGWYPDPWRQASLRWFDGRQWTAYVTPNEFRAPQPDRAVSTDTWTRPIDPPVTPTSTHLPADSQDTATPAPTSWADRALKRIAGKNYPL